MQLDLTFRHATAEDAPALAKLAADTFRDTHRPLDDPDEIEEYVAANRHYVPGGSGPSAIYKRSSNATNTTYYLATDHLGSTDVITDSTGAVLVHTSFGAFGERRGSTWTGVPSAAEQAQIEAITRRGFTFHEHLDPLGLIHMNGRVYSPQNGRFTSADPFVQAPYFSQSLNRYAYTFNNPLSYTDPSGFTPDDDTRGYCDRHNGTSCWDTLPPMVDVYYPSMIRPQSEMWASDGRYRLGTSEPVGPLRNQESTEDGSDEDKCTFTDFVRDFGNAIRTSIYNLPNISIALEFQGEFGLNRNGEYSQYSFSLGVNSLLQGFAQMQGGSNLQGNGDIAVLSSGFNLGYASRAMETGVGQVHTTTGYAYVGPGVSAGIERGAGSAEGSLPTSAAPRSLGRLNAGIGLALGYMHGQATEYTGATDALFGLIDRPGEYSGCGGKF